MKHALLHWDIRQLSSGRGILAERVWMASDNKEYEAGGRGCRLAIRVACVSALVFSAGCSMQEEVKRIEQVKQLEQRRAAATSTNLTGQQIFIRSCNTCHPGGRAGLGPSLSGMSEHFPSDKALASFIRKGKGMMPGQPKETLNDKEMDSLVAYLRALKL